MFLKPKPQNLKPETLSEVEDLGTVKRGPSDSIYLEVASKSFLKGGERVLFGSIAGDKDFIVARLDSE